MLVSNRKGLANRVQRILKVNDLHIPVADAARDLGIDELLEEHVNKLVLGNGVVHHSHETWFLRGITFCGKCGA